MQILYNLIITIYFSSFSDLSLCLDIREYAFQKIWHSSQPTIAVIFSYFKYIPYKLYKATAFLAESWIMLVWSYHNMTLSKIDLWIHWIEGKIECSVRNRLTYLFLGNAKYKHHRITVHMPFLKQEDVKKNHNKWKFLWAALGFAH